METETRKRIPISVLRTVLEPMLSRHFEAPLRISALRRRHSVYSSSNSLENLEVELNGGKRLRLVLKDLSPGSLLPTARQVRPRFFYEPRREIEIYRNLLSSQTLGTPICYGAVESPELERYWLFLERVNGPLLWQRGRLEAWEQAARWLARLHTRFGKADDLSGHSDRTQPGHLLRYGREFFSLWLTRAQKFLRWQPDGHSLEALRRFDHLADGYEKVVRRLLDLPLTFIHGEFYPSNVIVRLANGRQEICPVDWEMAAVGPGLLDLAALTAGNWAEEKKISMVRAYRDASIRNNVWPPPVPDLLEAVEYCQLHLAVQWLGWASKWSPPKRQAQNWLLEAVRLSRKLGI